MGEPQVPATFERSAPAGSSSLAIPGSGVSLPGREIPLELSCEREKDARLPAQPSGVVRKLIPRRGRQAGWHLPLSSKGVTAVFCEPEAEKNSVKRGIIPL